MSTAARPPYVLPGTARLSRSWGAVLVLVVAVAAYANSLGNGFAYDDVPVIEDHPAVASGDVGRAITASYWPPDHTGARGNLYRPVTLASFTLERKLWGPNPLPFHALNVLAHAAVSVLLFFLLVHLGAGSGVGAGAAVVFAVHPVHTEAVANVVGRAELYAALFVLLACLLYLRGRDWGSAGRSGRLVGVAALYFLALGSKEMAVTLPGVLLLLEALREGEKPYVQRLREELPLYALLGVTLLAHFGLRHQVLGVLLGEEAASALVALGTGERLLTALNLWPEYMRLLLFPLDLSSSYHPGVLMPARSWEPMVWAGVLILLGLLLAALRTYRSAPLAAAGIGWFALTVLPVSNLFFPTGVLLAERTLYLPSVGLALVVASGARAAGSLTGRRRAAVAVGAVAVVALLAARTVLRNPVWESTETQIRTLAREHPESELAIRARADGLLERGRDEEAGRLLEIALAFSPDSYSLMGHAAEFYSARGERDRAEELLWRAVALRPGRPAPYEYLAEKLVRWGRPDDAIRVAADGLARSSWTADLWALVSEAHILAGRLPAAERAREAAVAVDPESERDWRRLGEIRAALGDDEGARVARRRSRALDGPETRERSKRRSPLP